MGRQEVGEVMVAIHGVHGGRLAQEISMKDNTFPACSISFDKKVGDGVLGDEDVYFFY